MSQGLILWLFAVSVFVLAAAQQPANDFDLQALRTLIDKGHGSAALTQLDDLAARTPEPAGVERLRGIAFYNLARYAEADSAFQKAIEQDPNDQKAEAMRGTLLFRMGKTPEAIALLERLHGEMTGLETDPRYVLALCYLRVNRYDEARRALAELYGLEPESAAAYQLAGRLFLHQGRQVQAQQAAKKAVTLSPRQPLAHMLLGEIHLSLQQPAQAVAEFEIERTLNPSNGAIYDHLGDAYSRTGDYEKAERALQSAILLEPNAIAPFQLLGKVLLLEHRPSDASAYLEHAAAMNSGNAATHTLLAQAYRELGRTEDADRELTSATKLQPATKSGVESAQ